MSKEWLEEIRKLLVNLYNAVDVDEEMKHYIFNDLKIEWLIEQAERVQELESELNKQIEIGYKFEGEAYDLAKENKRYREALKNIYELAEYDEYDNTLEQIVSEIKKALEETK